MTFEPMQRVYWLITSAALTMILLIGFQVYWMNKSKELIEEQFTNKVSMALCSAVDKLSKSPACSQAATSCMTSKGECADKVQAMVKDSSFAEVLNSSLNYYQVNLPYKVNVSFMGSSRPDTPAYSCSLAPVLAQNDQWLQLIFQGKQDYFYQKIRFTLFSSILIVLLILSLFVYAARSLIRQQKISEDNRHFFNHMTHEFSTPLTNIQLASKMMKKNPSVERKEYYLNIIDQQSVLLKKQVDNVLQMANLDRDNFTLHKESIHLQSLARDVVESMKMQIHEKNATVQIHPDDQDYIIQGDRQHLRNVFTNLIDNALKYCDTEPLVNIDFYPAPQGWYVSVRDNGIGIPYNENDKIFSRYYRCSGVPSTVTSSNKSSTQGFGLGLAYVKKILNLHQGDIRLVPSMHTGARFELFFPK
jgi:two-component system, OmpR family, phosphate regulon sensor histidine kinase PhoR